MKSEVSAKEKTYEIYRDIDFKPLKNLKNIEISGLNIKTDKEAYFACLKEDAFYAFADSFSHKENLKKIRIGCLSLNNVESFNMYIKKECNNLEELTLFGNYMTICKSKEKRIFLVAEHTKLKILKLEYPEHFLNKHNVPLLTKSIEEIHLYKVKDIEILKLFCDRDKGNIKKIIFTTYIDDTYWLENELENLNEAKQDLRNHKAEVVHYIQQLRKKGIIAIDETNPKEYTSELTVMYYPKKNDTNIEYFTIKSYLREHDNSTDPLLLAQNFVMKKYSYENIKDVRKDFVFQYANFKLKQGIPTK